MVSAMTVLSSFGSYISVVDECKDGQRLIELTVCLVIN